MDIDISQLGQSSIFEGLSPREIEDVLEQIFYTIKPYSQGQIIFSQHRLSHSLGIILEGKVKVAKFLPSGKNIIIARFTPPASFGEGTVFSQQEFNPSTVMADSRARILFIDQANLLKLFAVNQQIMTNFLKLLSRRLLLLNQKISLLSLSSIREKLSYYLLDLSDKQNSLTVRLPYTRTYLANYLCIPRPSLSRELSRMQKDGLILSEGRKITIIDIQALENLLL
ncbi:MAG: Crp/Fnr family transcriptional regulator [Actinomycetia bacterium]|nr:Crp/Fnr family transcriptional regulator [Actinomycetes bacterium]